MLIAMIALTACTSQEETLVTAKTKKVDVTISVGPDGDLRALFDRDETTGAIGALKMVEKDVNLYVGIKAGDAGEPVMQTLKFTKVPGENRAVYSGQITVPISESGNYKIAAVLLSEEGGLTYATPLEGINARIAATSTQLVAATGNSIEEKVPYYTDWIDCSLADGVLNPITLPFKPEGTLLRLQLKNLTETEQDLKSITFNTTAFRRGGAYYFASYAQGRPGLGYNHDAMTYTFPTTTVLAKQSDGSASISPYYYIWVVPLEGGDIALETVIDIEKNDGTKLAAVFSSKQALPRGSVPLRINITNKGVDASFEGMEEIGVENGSWGSGTAYKLPTEYFAAYDVNADGSAFVKNYSNTDGNVGYFTPLETTYETLKNGVNIEGKNYSMPTYSELLSIIPPRRDGAQTAGTATLTDVVETNIKLGSITRSFTADYVSNGSIRACYAVRFKSAGNQYRTAFRYKYVADGDNTRLEIKCRYLGTSQTTITDVAQESFWSDSDVPLVIPFRGSKNSQGVFQNTGLSSFYWTSSKYSYEGCASSFINQYATRVWGFASSIRLPVRLYLRD